MHQRLRHVIGPGVGGDHGVVIALAGIGIARKGERCQGSGASDREPLLHRMRPRPRGALTLAHLQLSINVADVAKIGRSNASGLRKPENRSGLLGACQIEATLLHTQSATTNLFARIDG